jgi:DNA/RNA-binding domain of Phe-tRNA-synthetase-like protein
MSASPIFAVSTEIFARHPDYVVGCVLARGIDNQRAYPEIAALLDSAEAATGQQLAARDPKDEPAIAVWRAVFAQRGWTPSKYPASVEALVKRVAKGGALPRVNPIVNLGNAAVLRNLTPVGAHDLAQLAGQSLKVREARESDTFQPMGDATPEAPDIGEIVYAVGNVVRTRRWVWRQAGNALVTAATADVFFPVDGFQGATEERVQHAVALLERMCRDVFGALVTTGLVTAETPEFFGVG